MVEVVVAAVIFALTAVGFYATISALTAPAEQSSRDVTAAFLGKQKLEELRSAVDATTWDSGSMVANPLAPGVHPAQNVVVDGITYSVQYTVFDDNVDGNGRPHGRRVSVNVTY